MARRASSSVRLTVAILAQVEVRLLRGPELWPVVYNLLLASHSVRSSPPLHTPCTRTHNHPRAHTMTDPRLVCCRRLRPPLPLPPPPHPSPPSPPPFNGPSPPPFISMPSISRCIIESQVIGRRHALAASANSCVHSMLQRGSIARDATGVAFWYCQPFCLFIYFDFIPLL